MNQDFLTLEEFLYFYDSIDPRFPSSYFSPEEFASTVPSCDIRDVKPEALYRLNLMRHFFGAPIRLNCAFRSKDWDVDRGRSGNSFHCRGLAFDVCSLKHYNSGLKQPFYELVSAALLAGFTGIGIYPRGRFIHVDLREHPLFFIGD